MKVIRRYPCASFVALVVLTPYAVLVSLRVFGVPQDALKPLKLIFAMTPLLFVWLVAYAQGGDQHVRDLFAKLWRWRVGVRWYFAAMLTFAFVAFAALGMRWVYDGFFPPCSEFASFTTILLMSPPLLLFPGLTEEFAWRGFLQSELQRKTHWWRAALLVGIVWGSWHGFDFLLGNWSFEWPWILGYPVYIVSTSIIVGWIYKHGRESVFLAMLAHFGANVVNFYIPVFDEYEGSQLPAILYLAGLCLVAIVIPISESLMYRGRQRSVHDVARTDSYQ